VPADAERPRGNRAKRAQRCPVCGRPSVAEHRPFCSARCKDVDLGRWLKGTYRIPTEEQPEPGEGPPEDE
jgi:hypothetical protein